MSIIGTKKHANWPFRSDLLGNSRTRPQLYRDLRALYLQEKSPILAYALICPALSTENEEIIPELIERISANAPLKKQFDEVYGLWRKRLAPDF